MVPVRRQNEPEIVLDQQKRYTRSDHRPDRDQLCFIFKRDRGYRTHQVQLQRQPSSAVAEGYRESASPATVLQTEFCSGRLRSARSLSPISPPASHQHRSEDGGADQQAQQTQLAGRVGQVLVSHQAVHCGPDQRRNQQQHQNSSGDRQISASATHGTLFSQVSRRAGHDPPRSFRRALPLVGIQPGKCRQQIPGISRGARWGPGDILRRTVMLAVSADRRQRYSPAGVQARCGNLRCGASAPMSGYARAIAGFISASPRYRRDFIVESGACVTFAISSSESSS